MVLVNKGCVQATRLTYLLFDHVVAEAFNLEIVLHALIDRHDCLAELLVGLPCQPINSCIQIKLVKDKELVFFGPAFIDSKEKVLCHAAVVSNFVRLAILRLFLSLRLLHLVFIVNDAYLAEDQRP